MIKIASWNINSVRTRLPNLLQWLSEAQPDIVLLQEIKCTNEQFPYAPIEDLGYNIAVHGQKSFNGVAILSKFKLEDICCDLMPPDSRYIEAIATINKNTVFRVASVYVPNGGEVGSDKFSFKLQFLDQLYAKVASLLKFGEILIIGGDYNVAPQNIDVYDPESLYGSTCFHIEEQKRFRKILYNGMTDSFRELHPHKHEFSWWDYRAGAWQHNRGMRIDHILLSPEAADRLNDAYIQKQWRDTNQASDHEPVVCELRT